MGDDMITEGMLDMFIFETEQGLENLENICLESKDVGEFDEDNVNEIFRIMHTIKGSSAVMMFQNVATLAHKLEDVFYFILSEKVILMMYHMTSLLMMYLKYRIL